MVTLPEAVLLVRGGPDEGTTYSLSQGMTTLGRTPLNDIVVDTPGVSRQHAGIRCDSEGYWIADLDSRNGTYVNGEKLGVEPRRLNNFDRVELGGKNTTVHWVFMESQVTVDMRSTSS